MENQSNLRTVVALYLLGLSNGSTLGVKHDIISALRIYIFERLGEAFYRNALEHLQSVRSGEKKKKE